MVYGVYRVFSVYRVQAVWGSWGVIAGFMLLIGMVFRY